MRFRDFRPGEWSADPYAKECARCDTVVGRFGVMVDEDGLYQVTWWPHTTWDGVAGSYHCRAHSVLAVSWERLFDLS